MSEVKIDFGAVEAVVADRVEELPVRRQLRQEPGVQQQQHVCPFQHIRDQQAQMQQPQL